MKNKKSILVALLAVCAVAGIFLFNKFSASIIDREELVDIFLNLEVYDQNGDKVYFKDSDLIEITDNKGNEIEYTNNNGEITVAIPLYEYDEEKTGDIVKNISIDNNSHYMVIQDDMVIKTYEASQLFKATKNDENLDVELDNYNISFPKKYKNDILVWSLSKETEQTFTNDDYTVSLKIKGENLYKTPVITSLSGDSNIHLHTDPCEYRNVEVVDKDDSSYLKYTLEDSNEVYSIATGEVIATNDVENYIIIQYNDGIFIKYQNVIPVVFDSKIKRGELIGYCNKDTLELHTCDNGKWIASEWLYDGYERPEEGMNMPRMYQAGQEWSDIQYGTSTIGKGGCGPSAFAMAISGIKGKVYTPEDIVNIIKSMGSGNWYYQRGIGSNYTIFPKLADYFDINIDDSIGTSEAALKQCLNEGKVVIISIYSGKVYKGDGHFIVLRGLTEDGKFLINDSSTSFDLNTGYDYSDLTPIRSARAIWE